MSNLLSYSISDFLLFSPEVYWRLVNHYLMSLGELVWLFAIASGVALVAAIKRKLALWLYLYFAFAWIWLGWRFFINDYATINWFAEIIGYSCFAQGILVILASKISPRFKQTNNINYYLSISVLVIVVSLAPILAIVANLPWSAGLIGLQPLPTYFASIAFINLFHKPAKLLLLPIPLILLIIELLTLDQLSWHLF